jgi:hypothetical protein
MFPSENLRQSNGTRLDPIGSDASQAPAGASPTEVFAMNALRMIGYSLPLLLSACASAPDPVTVPPNLVPEGERVVDRLSARGTQTYECRAQPQRAPAWLYVGADLDLTDALGRSAGKHTAQPPFWTAPDGSRLQGTIKARADAPRPAAAQWLLVSTRSIGGDGRFARITSLQRVNTQGGVAPASPCDQSTLGKQELVPFATDYILFAR